MRLDALEREALKYALNDFDGDAYLFGSRIDDTKRGGDIDILLVPKERTNSFKLSLGIQRKFFSKCEENIDKACAILQIEPAKKYIIIFKILSIE